MYKAKKQTWRCAAGKALLQQARGVRPNYRQSAPWYRPREVSGYRGGRPEEILLFIGTYTFQYRFNWQCLNVRFFKTQFPQFSLPYFEIRHSPVWTRCWIAPCRTTRICLQQRWLQGVPPHTSWWRKTRSRFCKLSLAAAFFHQHCTQKWIRKHLSMVPVGIGNIN